MDSRLEEFMSSGDVKRSNTTIKSHIPDYIPGNDYVILADGTTVTCEGRLVDASGNVWIKISSGYICAYSIIKDAVFIR